MASGITFNSSLPGLVRIYTDDHKGFEGFPGTAYFEFSNHADAKSACIQCSKSWELYCEKQVPRDIENGKCFGFAVRPEAKAEVSIISMLDLIGRINYWMGGTSHKEDKQISVERVEWWSLKDRDFSVPQKDYSYLQYFGLKLAIEDPYMEPQGAERPNEIKNALVSDLKGQPRSTKRDEIIRKAIMGDYSDFNSSFPLPKTQLVLDLQAIGFNELAEHAVNGKYDD